ncbi:MAG: hypothetical protein RMX68_031865 [Aulosira sp. ZfuVER01]|nr:hypothetical protein [Aulosira sp. ZfuVER01]MDZ8000503.1 hypothetical protein [Aulosira sp. DedVER01a]MDZ8056459.1 hypothetical protein [Aulosira sp. ZfuCHP01]
MNTLDQNQSKQNTKVQRSPRTLGLQDATVLISLILIAGFVRFGNIEEQDRSNFPDLTNTSEVVTNKDVFIGKTVTIRSKPVQKVGLSSFTINDQPRIIQEPILVVNASGVPFDLPVNRNTKVEVTGQVRNFVISEIERDYNLSLQAEDYKGYINRPAIIAKSIKVVQ